MKYDKYIEEDKRIVEKNIRYDKELRKRHEKRLQKLKDESDKLIEVNIDE